MEWFQGSIEQAIKQVREASSLLCVFIKDDKEASTEMTDAISAVSHVFQGHTSIQLVYDTATCKQFSVYYPILIVPSIYIVDGSGVNLAVIADKNKIVNILSEVTQSRSLQPAPAVAPQAAPSVVPTTTPQTSPADHDISTTVTPESIGALIDRSSGNVPTVVNGNFPSTSSGITDAQKSLEEQKERARQILEEKQMKDQAAAAEELKEKERKRRLEGQAIAEQKKRKESEEMKRHSESIRRDKASQKAEMEEIRAQIARDKAERRGEKYTPPVAAPSTAPSTPSLPEGKVRVQIKFPATDSTLAKTFDETDSLVTVVEYAKEQLKKDNFTLWNTFPRKQFKSADLNQSLQSLGLKGSVSLLGMSGKGYTPAPTPVPEEQPCSSTAGNFSSNSNDKPLSQTRIQFKKSDGTSLLHIFDKDTLLVDVVKHFQNECEDLGDSVLWSLYPRYEITHDHVQQTLAQLNMCPSAVIFVLPPSNQTSTNQVGTGSTGMFYELLLTLIQLPINILQYLKNILFPARPSARPRPPPLTPTPSETDGGSGGSTPLDTNSLPDSNSDGLRKRTKLDGNVTRLSNNSANGEDDTNTWNGNSTQLQ